jgi:transposase
MCFASPVGLHVVPSASQVSAATGSGAKSDAGDAAVIAQYLRLRSHRLRAATPFSPQTKALRTVVRTRDTAKAVRYRQSDLDSWIAAKVRTSTRDYDAAH